MFWKLADFAWHGLVVPENIITAPHLITIERIIQEKNVELKRALLEIYGTARFLLESEATLVNEDECGILYSVSTGDDEEPLNMVKVVDATHTRKEYLLRVPPELETAREAVAWTFGLSGEDYNPTIQT